SQSRFLLLLKTVSPSETQQVRGRQQLLSNQITFSMIRQSLPFQQPDQFQGLNQTGPHLFSVLAIGRQLTDMMLLSPDKQQAPPLATSTPVQRVEPTVVSCVKRPNPMPCNPAPSSQPAPPTQVISTKSQQQLRVIPSSRNEPLGLNVADFLPVSFLFPLLQSEFPAAAATETCRRFDPCGPERTSSYMQTGSTSLKLIMKHFWTLISETLKASPAVGVDITREERHQKCRECCRHLKNLSNVVKNRARQVGRHGNAFKELQLLMAPLDEVL
ncbi:hypothetical protein GOODEAATRI_007204, partial [Goodea atripinnis]